MYNTITQLNASHLTVTYLPYGKYKDVFIITQQKRAGVFLRLCRKRIAEQYAELCFNKIAQTRQRLK